MSREASEKWKTARSIIRPILNVTAHSYRIITAHQRRIEYGTYWICAACRLHRYRVSVRARRDMSKREREISRRSDNDKEREKERVGKIGAMVSRARGIISTRPTQPMFRGIDPFLTSRKCKQWWNLRRESIDYAPGVLHNVNIHGDA